MPDKNPIDSEIVKALECCKSDTALCNECPYDKIGECIEKMCADSIDLINRQKAIIEKSEKVEHFADKTIETANAEIENLKVENQSLRSAANSLKMHYEKAQAEIERLLQKTQRPQDADPMDFCGVLCDFAEGLIVKAKAEAYKEFAERLKENWQDNDYYWEEADVYKWIDNLLKELVGENND